MAQENTVRPHFVRATGEATIKAKPDRAEITIGVSTKAGTAEAASNQNASESNKLQSALKQALGSGGEIKTSGYSLSPQYDYPQGHAPRLNGYQAENTVNVTVDDLSLLGKVIDAATANGANQINGISFTLKDSSEVRSKALAQAAVNARANAESIAKALGVTVVALLEAEPAEAPAVRPLMMQTRMMAAAPAQAPTPVEAGDLDIHATVSVTLEVR